MSSSRKADIHCHLLPQWDDGPRSLESALKMARRAAENGISDILVTPHVGRDLSGIGIAKLPAAQKIPAAVTALQDAVRADGLTLNLWPSAELVLSPDLPAQLDREPGLATGRAQRYVLLELLPGAPWTDGVDDILFHVALRGLTPIMAHPERYSDVQRDVEVARRAASRGNLFQLTAASLLSKGAIRETAFRLLDAGLISFVASDAHQAEDIWPQQVEEILTARLGEEGCRKLQANALALVPDPSLDGEDGAFVVGPAQPVAQSGGDAAKSATEKAGSLWQRWFGRKTS